MEALATVGWHVVGPLGRDADLSPAADGVDLLVIATPDAAIAEVAGTVTPNDSTVVAHLAGSLGLGVLEPHRLRAAIHPLVPLPSAAVGADRLRSGGWFAIAGHEIGRRVVADLGGRAFEVTDDDRAAYHAAACVASNHLVALLGQVERIAGATGVPFEAYLNLVQATLDNVEDLGPAAALTGPAARGDWLTIGRHRASLDPSELEAYDAMVAQARRLVVGGGYDSAGGARQDHAPEPLED